MHIIGLQAENFKRLQAVSIQLNGEHLVVGGDNEQGKSSVLDAVWVALGGSDAMKNLKITKPIRKGAEKASITLDLGDLIVTRNWTADDRMYLKVSTKDGAEYKSPQGMLDALMGKLFDPFEFSRMKDAEQKEILLKLVNIGLDLEKWAAIRKGVYDERTEVNRTVKQLEGQLAGIPLQPEETPDEERSSADVLAEMRKAQQVNQDNEAKRQELREFAAQYQRELNGLQTLQDRHDAIEKEIKRLQDEAASVLSSAQTVAETIERMKEQGAKMKAGVEALKDMDLTVYDKELAELEAVNKSVRLKQERNSVKHKYEDAKADSDMLTVKLGQLDQQKEDAIKAAAFPIEGLGFDDNGVTFNGIPFGQCSSEERIRVGMAIAMAASPKLKVIRIADGSLLDAKNFTLIQEMAAGEGYQLLVEKVGDPGECGIIIEDGAVQSAEAPEAA